MLKLKDYIFLGIILLLLIIGLFKQCSSNKPILKEFENTHKLDSIQRLLKEKEDSILLDKIYIDSLNIYNDRLKKMLNKNTSKIKNIKNEAHKKDSIVSFYNANELELFFTERYDSTGR